MPTQFIDKKSSTTLIKDLPGAAGVSVVNGDLYVHDGVAPRKVVDAADVVVADALAALGVAAGYKIARGESALDGSNPTPIASGLATIVAVVATLKGSVAPGLGTSLITAVISGTSINFYGWKPTGATDPTLIASTGTESFYWIAVGT